MMKNGKFWQRAWSLIDQCTPVSEGCRHCWLKALNKRTGKPWDGKVTFRDDRIDIPLRTRKPTVFAIWSDLYHEAITNGQIEQAFDVMLEAKHHTFLIVTKRPERAAGNIIALPNVYHLVTVENQEMADERIPHALKIPGKVGLLIEPMLGPVELNYQRLPLPEPADEWLDGIDCVILGGETGPMARPMNPDWARSVRDQCRMAGVPFFLKHIDKKHGRVLDEQEHNELPWR